MEVSKLSAETPPSGIRAVFNKIAEEKEVISFALGEPDFTTPAPIIAAACSAFQAGKTHYTPNAGFWKLRQMIAESYGVGQVSPEQVVVTAGGTEALLLTLLTLLNPGDEVLVAEPYWPTYLGQIRACGAIPVFVRTYEADGFALKCEQVREAITPCTRMLLVNSPCNPTGAMLSQEDIEALATLAIEHDLIVLSDEVYRHIVYDEPFCSIAQLPGMAERCVIIDSFSKAYAMTGWRIGYVVAPPAIAAAMTNMHEYTVSCLPEPAQMAAMEALRSAKPYVDEMVAELKVRRNLVVDGINSIEKLYCKKPKAAFYLYFNISQTGLGAEDFVYRLLERKKIALSPGTAFGGGQEAYVRLSYANSQENLREGLARITEFVREL